MLPLTARCCPHVGDHGPINSWDRNAFISDVKYGYPSYTAEMNHVGHNMIIANYGASQGFDTDDGSSWYDIHDNFMFMADGKLDVFFWSIKALPNVRSNSDGAV